MPIRRFEPCCHLLPGRRLQLEKLISVATVLYRDQGLIDISQSIWKLANRLAIVGIADVTLRRILRVSLNLS